MRYFSVGRRRGEGRGLEDGEVGGGHFVCDQ